MYEVTTNALDEPEMTDLKRRLSSQPILPRQVINMTQYSDYDIYPYHALEPGTIFIGYESLATWISKQECVLIDGYIGVFWEEIQMALNEEFKKKGLKVKWVRTTGYLKESSGINKLVAPFLGTPDSLWGTKSTLTLKDFFLNGALEDLQPDPNYDISIAIGIGSALLNWKAPIIYLDIPKNELQYRMRAGSITNLGNNQTEDSKSMYKRFYFVDWVILNEHKKNILSRITVFADTQWINNLTWIFSVDLKAGLKQISHSLFRVRPWYEAGAWGGQWMKEHIKGLNKAEINYAWSFEMIVPENGILFESDGNLLEVPFDLLMLHQYQAVLGKHAEIFKTEFPIRFDFLDTFGGGNLSIQCHPSLPYIRKEFGENITQDETYYILDCKDDAKVYLGFREDINSNEFRKELENSRDNNREIDIEQFVQCHKAEKHNLFLIPNGTVHSAGTNNLVLEISATPYIFTFKMYDWLRMDLNGKPRAINIDHAFNNLKFERKGEKVISELISKPVTINRGTDWQLIHLPTHVQHFYDVHRIEFASQVTVKTNNVCHILMLVEGSSVTVLTADGTITTFNYAETFVIPAAATEYTLTNNGEGIAKVVKAFIKEELIVTESK